MTTKLIERLVAVSAAVVLGLVAAVAAMVLTGGRPVTAAPVAESTYGSIVASVSGAKTGNYTTTAASIRSYTLLQYGGSLALAEGQTVTAKIQVSFNNSTWLDYVTFHNAVGAAASVTPAQTNAVGMWVRVLYTPVSSTLTYTPTFWVVVK